MASRSGTQARARGDDRFFASPAAEIHVPDGVDPAAALARTTHLAIVAHPDDLEFSAFHGIAECYAHPDRWFTGVVLTDGVGGPSLGADNADLLRAERSREQRSAADLGRYSAVVLLGATSAELKAPTPPAALTADLAALVRRCAAGTAYLHAPTDRHDTHVAALVHAHRALAALEPAERPGAVWGVEGWRDLDWLVGDERVALPVDAHPELAAALLGLFESQVAGGKRYDLAVAARRRAHATFGDAHAPDGPAAVTLALDLAPTLRAGGPTLRQLARRAVARLGDDVDDRLARSGAP